MLVEELIEKKVEMSFDDLSDKNLAKIKELVQHLSMQNEMIKGQHEIIKHQEKRIKWQQILSVHTVIHLIILFKFIILDMLIFDLPSVAYFSVVLLLNVVYWQVSSMSRRKIMGN